MYVICDMEYGYVLLIITWSMGMEYTIHNLFYYRLKVKRKDLIYCLITCPLIKLGQSIKQICFPFK